MRILAFEFSTDRRSVALLDTALAPARVGGGTAVHTDGRSTPICALVQSVLEQTAVEREAIDTIAIGNGPGSYTGIRVAIAFARGWQLARAVRLVGVSSVECLAAQQHAEGARGPILVVVDGQRGEFYLAGYQLGPHGWDETEPLRLVPGTELEQRIEAGAQMIGPDTPERYRGILRRFPEAAVLARLAAGRAALGPDEALEPVCLRPVSFIKAPPVSPRDSR